MDVDRGDSGIMSVGGKGVLPGEGLELPTYNSEEQMMSKEQRGREAEWKHLI